MESNFSSVELPSSNWKLGVDSQVCDRQLITCGTCIFKLSFEGLRQMASYCMHNAGTMTRRRATYYTTR